MVSGLELEKGLTDFHALPNSKAYEQAESAIRQNPKY